MDQFESPTATDNTASPPRVNAFHRNHMTLTKGNTDAESVEQTSYMDVRRLQRRFISFRAPSDSRQAILFVAFGDEELRKAVHFGYGQKTEKLPIN